MNEQHDTQESVFRHLWIATRLLILLESGTGRGCLRSATISEEQKRQ